MEENRNFVILSCQSKHKSKLFCWLRNHPLARRWLVDSNFVVSLTQHFSTQRVTHFDFEGFYGHRWSVWGSPILCWCWTVFERKKWEITERSVTQRHKEFHTVLNGVVHPHASCTRVYRSLSRRINIEKYYWKMDQDRPRHRTLHWFRKGKLIFSG